MNYDALVASIREKKSFLCVGLDPDPGRIPSHFHSYADPVFEFNKAIIDATKKWCVAYKPNLAFYEAMGTKGWETLIKTVEYIPDTHFKIADAKRGDIGNTAAKYAKTFFETMQFDAITISPYMGRDSVEPFLEYDDKWVIVLGLTSNKGNTDLQMQEIEGRFFYEKVLETAASWGNYRNTMFVVGATQPEAFKTVRKYVPDHFLLVPGVGAQGGDLRAVCENGINDNIGLLVNSSRGIIYASEDISICGEAAKNLNEQMAQQLSLLALS